MSTIDELLQPTLFRNSYHRASINLLYTAVWLEQRQEGIVASAPYRLTWPQYSTLVLLRERYPYAFTVADLEDRIPYIRAEDISSALNRLVKRSLAEYHAKAAREEDKGFKVTIKGLEMLSQMDSQKLKRLDRLIESLSPSEAEQLSRMLDCIRTPTGTDGV